jgi:integrase
LSLGSAIESYLTEIRRSRSVKTIAACDRILQVFGSRFPGRLLDDISREDLLDHRAALQREGLSPRTIYNHIMRINSFLRSEGITGLLKPGDKPTYDEPEVEAYDSDQLESLLCTADNEEQYSDRALAAVLTLRTLIGKSLGGKGCRPRMNPKPTCRGRNRACRGGATKMHTHNFPLQGTKSTRDIVLTLEQVGALLDATRNQPDYGDLHDAARIMLRSTIRPRELARLRWTDFQFGLRVMRIKQPKDGSFRGTILDPETVARLQSRRDRAGDTEFVMGTFPEHGMARVARQFCRIGKTLSFPECGLTILRRTAMNEAIAHLWGRTVAVAR